ncbi:MULTISPECIES: type II methionyl aminopeptidase [unclassified Methanoculleus]|uniref:type II methionyl aminopeptidase n=1 Tax=unclassified Methanoculleus TaxID=2619537 RepID=UPI0025FF4574|nr:MULTISPECIES: type II methionyl aminopeptidase [unclassified Methanoculleus]MCK9318943.1 type II methionyl aminopeptidase [Methanoculleus sp.]MDD2254918.1 type II methionyl aminopeptidase [Methanoculleus sp.]MDD2786663.1 type II methionyl aminopeptidase [Methanoculleus sp.]MDD3215467.1 type II methionyl aminopeptidase [Methanoculleus sp.]MDD4313259.1 type II methionyl aminopeptidase [Methanoculleus sp.]
MIMDDVVYDAYREAGALAQKILHRGAGLVKEGAGLLEMVEATETMVTEEGAFLAFPLNVSFNEAAAHDTAMPGDERVFARGDLVKVDLGVHIDGYIADTAMTVDLGDHGPLVEASRSALEAAIALVRPGVATGELGAAVQATIEEHGYKPVANLTGHGLDCYNLHTRPTIPNVAMSGGAVLEEGMVFAIEPFATTGSGRVGEATRVEIYQQIAARPARLPSAKRILETARPRRGLPFSRRWIPGDKVEIGLSTLVRAGILHPFPMLHDVPGSFVSQAEHTLIVTEEGCEVTTR